MMKYALTLGCLAFFSLLGITACEGPPAEEHAKRFCECSAELADALARKKAGKIDDADFTRIRDEHLQCMGNLEDPRANMSQEEINDFQQSYLRYIRQNCPNIGRNYGYQLD